MLANTIKQDNIIDSLNEIYDSIRNYNMDIAVVSLHEIITKCMQWIDDLDADFALLVKFHIIYTKLVYLKVASLFPQTDIEQVEEDISGLIRDIFDYKKSQQLSQALLSVYTPDTRLFNKKKNTALLSYLKNIAVSMPRTMILGNSEANLNRLVKEFTKFTQINQRLALAPKIKRFSLEQMRARILSRITNVAQSLRDMVNPDEKAYHVVAAMLSILALCNERCISIEQQYPFDSIILNTISSQ